MGGQARRLLTVMAAVLALVMTGCGQPSGQPSGDAKATAEKALSRTTTTTSTTTVAPTTATTAPRAVDVVLAASTQTVSAKTSKVHMQMLMTGVPQAPNGSLAITSDGLMDFVNRRGQFTMTIPQMGSVQAVVDGLVVYEKFPPAIGQYLGSKPWVKVDTAELANSAGLDLSSLSQTQSSDPTQGLQMLTGVGSDVTVVGADQLRGAKVTHYRGTIDLTKAATSVPSEQKKLFAQLAKVYGGQTLPMDAWLDDQGRLRKFTYSVDMSKLKLPATASTLSTPSGTMTLTMELFDFGTPVNVVVPPSSEVTDFAELMAKASHAS